VEAEEMLGDGDLPDAGGLGATPVGRDALDRHARGFLAVPPQVQVVVEHRAT
jgi:hypothetical protein